MFVIFGLSNKRHPIGAYEGDCNACLRPAVHIGLVEKRAFSVFWIPLIPLGSGKKMVCTSCGAEHKVKALPPHPSFLEIAPSQIRPRTADLMMQQGQQRGPSRPQ